MDQEKLNSLIDRLEDYARRNPGPYRFRVALLAGLGYAYLFFVILALLGLIFVLLYYIRFSALTLKLVWIPLVLIGLVLRSLWVTIPAPDGTKLSEDETPRLFEDVREIQKVINGPRVHHVLLTDDFNAGIVQVPRFGMFGWLSNYLVVGLPLLKALSVDEVRAILAHEFGHLSGKHGRFSGWIYRVRQSWAQILTRVHQERHYASFIFEPFLNWYAPFFNAYSFVLARAQEYEADGYSVDVAGKETTARMLVRMSTKARTLSDQFWPDFYRQATHDAKPPRDPFARMLAAVEMHGEEGKLRKWALQELTVKTGHEDTHPALGARLLGLGYRNDELASLVARQALVPANTDGHNAAGYYLDVVPEGFVHGCDRIWKEEIWSTWRDYHNAVETASQRLKELDTANRARDLTIEERWEQAVLVYDTREPTEALPLVRDFLQAQPDHAEANLMVGAMLVQQGDAAGIDYLEKAMSLSESLTGEALGRAYDFYLEVGQVGQAENCRAGAERFAEKLRRLHEQATNVTSRDQFEFHGLSTIQVDQLREKLKGIHGLGRTYLVRKVVEDAPVPVYVLGVFATYTWRSGVNAKHIDALVNEVASVASSVPLFNLTIVSLDVNENLIKKFGQVPDALLLPGGDETVEMRH